MRFKQGVVFWRMHPEIEAKMAAIDEVTRAVVGRDAIITSGRDGDHSEGSLHYEGAAVDLRTRDLQPMEIEQYAKSLRNRLGPSFDVIVEESHIHLEWDPS